MANLFQLHLKILRILRENVNWEIETERFELLVRIDNLFMGWMGQLPNLQKIFQKGEIDRLLLDSVSYVGYRKYRLAKRFVEFVANTGYKNEPDADEGGKLCSRRTTAVHRVAKRSGLLKYIILDVLFKIFNRFDVNYTDESGLSHLHVACKFGYYGVVEKFLEAGQDPNCLWQKTGDSPLHLALARGCWFMSELLLKNGADPNLANTAGSTPLHFISMRKNCLAFAKMLFELSDSKYQPLQVNVQDKYNETPLHKALLYGHRKLVEFLLRRDANPHLANVAGLTSLHVICGGKRDDYSLAKMLFELSNQKYQPEQIDARTNLGSTPLNLAVPVGHKNLVQFLLRKGADPSIADNEGCTPLHYACRTSHDDYKLVEMLLELSHTKHRPVQVNAQNSLGNTPLHERICSTQHYGSDFIVELLLRNGADPNLANEKGWTPLHLICQRGDGELDDVALVESFFRISKEMNRTVRVDAKDNYDLTPFQWALRLDLKKIAASLLRNGANPNVTDAKGLTMLHILCSDFDCHRLVESFFKICDDHHQTLQVNAQNKLGDTPLHLALKIERRGVEKVIELLLRRGANPNLLNAKRLTSLHVVCMRSRDDGLVHKFFQICDDIQQPVRVNVKGRIGPTPLQLAVANLKPDTVDALLNRGADLSSFVFPTKHYYGLDLQPEKEKLKLMCGALAVVEHLEERKYKLDRRNAMTIIELFAKFGLFKTSVKLGTNWYDEEFVNIAKKLMIRPSLSLYDALHLGPEKADKLPTFREFHEFWRSDNLRQACPAHLCEIITRRFLRRWGLMLVRGPIKSDNVFHLCSSSSCPLL
uniref:Uncharacterized protein n=1 Tax=Trichogramma kaykai TaxID=54128 RepID=A0ABD2WX65_9HYME